MEKGKELTADQIQLGKKYQDNRSMNSATVCDKTQTSICMRFKRSSDKGIDCTNWFELGWWNRYFEFDTMETY